MSIMNRIDGLMLVVARIFLGVLFVQNLASLIIKWLNPWLNFHGLPHIGVPLLYIILWIVCLWNLPQFFFRLVLGVSAGLLIFINVLALFLAIEKFKTASMAIRADFDLILLLEGFVVFGLISMLWVSLSAPKSSYDSSFRHAVHSV